jgi:F-type H+-transporting ATPase subunit delta
MPNETLARRYATAIFQLASEAGDITGIGRDLHTFIAALAADADVNRFFRSPVVDRAEKSAVIAQAFDKLNEVALHAILLLIRKRREALAPEIVAQFDVLERQARGAQTLNVTSARPLAKADLDALVTKLTAAFKTPFDVTQNVDPELIGGVRITMGDKRIDGTIAGRLDDLARMLSTN